MKEERWLVEEFCLGDIGDTKNEGILGVFESPEHITLQGLLDYAVRAGWYEQHELDAIEWRGVDAGISQMRQAYRELEAHFNNEYRESPSDWPVDCHAQFHIKPVTMSEGLDLIADYAIRELDDPQRMAIQTLVEHARLGKEVTE